MLLCQFLVLGVNRFWLNILLCTWSTIQLWCCVSYFGSGGKLFLVLRMYLVYNTVVREKKSCCRLSGGCAIIFTTGKKSSSRLSGRCAITTFSTTGPNYTKSSDFYAKLNVSNLNVTNSY